MNLRKIRRMCGLTMKQVARAVGVSEGAISLYERNLRRPSLETAFKIAKVLGCTVDDLFEKEG